MPPIAMAHYTNPNRTPIEATMIRGENCRIEIGNLNMDMTNQVNLNEGYLEKRYALDLLRSNCSLAALVDAKERYNSPRCTEETRRKILQEIEDWVYQKSLHDTPSSVFWLYGGAGAGKSALARTLAEKFKTNEDLAASFFFLKADVTRNDGDRLIPTLILQLVQSFQGLTLFVEQKILQNPDLFQKSRRIQILELLIEPLIRLSLQETDGIRSNPELKSHPRLFVIDGLDECLDSDTQCDLLRVIASAIPHFPYPFRFLITSRPESHITRVFEHDLHKAVRYNLSDDPDADKDIRKFLEGEFSEIHRTHPLRQHLSAHWPHQDAVKSIVERSSGHFIYASTVIRFIQSSQHRPDDRLQVILGFQQPYEKDRPYAPLDLLYRMIFLEVQDPGELEKIHRALGIMRLRSLKNGLLASSEWISDHHAIEVLLELRPGDLVLLFDRLLSLVNFEEDDIRIYHKTLFDYLLDSSRSGDLQLDLGLAHENAAIYILRGGTMQDDWNSIEFRDFVYHCQFARLNETLKRYLRSLALDRKVAFTKRKSGPLLRGDDQSHDRLLESILYLLQVFGRQDFESGRRCCRIYVQKTTRCLRSAIPWGQRLKKMRLAEIRNSFYVKKEISELLDQIMSSRGLQMMDPNGLTTPVRAANRRVVRLIKQEHEMFCSYVKERCRYPNTVSFLKPSTGLIHSCHFVIRPASRSWSLMLVTYTNDGVRLSCSVFEEFAWYDFLLENIESLFHEHIQTPSVNTVINVIQDGLRNG